MRTGIADLPLHGGHAPPWLFKRMKRLGRAIVEAIVLEYGTEEFIRRISDPYWFQSLSLVLGFDWHSSGTTTVTLGALKESVDPSLGLVIVGGKGKASKRTPDEIVKFGDELGLGEKKTQKLVKTSKLSAKVDNACLQDGYQLYHHSVIFDEHGNWSVIQQGMKGEWARRYHWFNAEDYFNDPERVAGMKKEMDVINLASSESEKARETIVDLVNDKPVHMERLVTGYQRTLLNWDSKLAMPKRINWNAIKAMYEIQPRNFEELVLTRGIGKSTLRALALISDVVFGKPPSYRDPIRYSFAVGGKDGVPFPVDREAMDKATLTLRDAIEMAKLGKTEKMKMLKRLDYSLTDEGRFKYS